MIKEYQLSECRNSLRETLLQVDERQIFHCNHQFESDPRIPFLEPSVLDKIFTTEEISINQRVGYLEKAGGLLHIMNRLKVDPQYGLGRFSGFRQRKQLYGVNFEQPSTIKKYFQKLKYVLEDQILIRFFAVMWIFAFVTESIFNRVFDYVQILASVLMFMGLLIAKVLIKNYVDLQINQSLNYSRSKTWVSVKREGMIVKILQSDLLVGDILSFSPNDNIEVDGIIIHKSDDIMEVDQYKSITQNLSARKTDGWIYRLDGDPFIFSGTQILSGSGEMLVCCVGKKCTFRVVANSKVFLMKRTKHIRQGEGKYIVFSMRLAQLIIVITICFKLMFLLFRLSPLDIEDLPLILKNIAHHLSWSLILQDMQRIQFMYCYIEKRIYQQKQFKIMNKRLFGELLKLDILLLDQVILEAQQHANNRDNTTSHVLHYQQILKELDTIIDIKILTERTLAKCHQYHFYKPFQISSPNLTPEQVDLFRDCKFICNIDPVQYFPHIINAYRSFGYKVGIIPIEIDENFDSQNVVVISTDDSSNKIQKMSWVKLNSSSCEEGLKILYIISTNFYILMIALINQHLLSLVMVIYGVFYLNIPMYYILLLANVEIFTVYATFEMLKKFENNMIESRESFWRNLVAHHVTIFFVFLYSISKIDNPKDLTFFLICRNIVSVVYNTRMGNTLLSSFRRKFMYWIYIILMMIIAMNIFLSYYFNSELRSAIIVSIMVGSMNFIYLIERTHNNLTRKKPNRSFK